MLSKAKIKLEEDNEIKKLSRYMSVRYIFALGVIFVLALGANIPAQSIVKSYSNYTNVINISGRQRMLSQRLALFSTKLINAKTENERQELRRSIREAVSLFELSHNGLIHGNKSMNLPGIRSDDVQDVYYRTPHNLDNKVKQYIEKNS